LPTDPLFLSEEAVLLIHRAQIVEWGGAQGVRDPGLLASALAQPRATFDAVYLHKTIHEMAAAYLFHIVQNHPFVDGNKRTGLTAALVFLDLNGVAVEHEETGLYSLTMAVAAGKLLKADVARDLARLFPLAHSTATGNTD